VFDGLLSERLLDHVDGLFSSQEVHELHSKEGRNGRNRHSRNVAVDIDEHTRELVDVLRSIGHIHEVERCCQVLISDVWGDSQDAHMDHVNIDELAHIDNNLQFLDLSRQSRSLANPRKVVPTFSVVVYFNHVGGICFPHALMRDRTIPGKRGRVVMFQNYCDMQRPDHNALTTHYGIYLDSMPKRVMTAGILSNETPAFGTKLCTGLLYCPGLANEGVRHDNPSYGNYWQHYDEPVRPKPVAVKKDKVLTLTAEFEGMECVVTGRTMGGSEACVIRAQCSDTISWLSEHIKGDVDWLDKFNVHLALPDGQLLAGLIEDGVDGTLEQVFRRQRSMEEVLDEALWLGLMNPTAARVIREHIRVGKVSEEHYRSVWEGKIEEATSAHRKVRELLALRKSDVEATVSIFREWDKDGNGVISEAELLEALQTLDVSFTREQLRAAVLVADADNDGNVDYTEFVNWLYKE